MSIDFDIVRQSLPALWQGLKLTAQVSGIGIPLGVLLGTIAAYMANSRTGWRVRWRSAMSSWFATSPS